MILDLTRIIVESTVSRHNDTTGGSKVFAASLDMDTFECSTGDYRITHKEPFELKVSVLGKNKVSITGSTSLELEMPCDRCLEPTLQTIEVEIDTEIDFDNLDDETLGFVDEHMIDVDKLLYSYIIMNLPMKVVCREDCAGLCRVCGRNLNTGSCDCDTFVPDPRMAAISDIFKQFNE